MPLIRFCLLRLKGRVDRQIGDACSRERKRRARLGIGRMASAVSSWAGIGIVARLKGDGVIGVETDRDSGKRSVPLVSRFPMGHGIPDRLMR